MKWIPSVLSALLASLSSAAAERSAPELIEVRKIWDQAPHNAFTDLIRFHDRWFCVFREGKAHVSRDGALRIITSKDGETWTSSALITSTNADLRDAKITITPKGELMLSGAGALHQPAAAKHVSYAWFSRDGEHWSAPVKIGNTNQWLWRVVWNRDTAYAIGYDTGGGKFVRLYSSHDGEKFETLVNDLFDVGEPNESTLVFLPDQTCLCLLRRDGKPSNGLLGRSEHPYTKWTWQDIGAKIGGPQMIQLPDGRLIGGGRLYDGKVRTSLFEVNQTDGKIRELLALPSGGDCSYPGLVWHEGVLWVSYYSSHEGKTSIYLAKVRI